ncbi:MAG: LysR family transcriptional regulator [Thermoplasmatales archaeon]|nr:LysR family transcriptional regulator [Thermoplasmatales archaeon]
MAAVHSERSKTAAARKLGISAPVVHKYMAEAEAAVGRKLMLSTPKGTHLTPEGEALLDTYRAMEFRCNHHRPFTVSCTPVTEELIMSVVSAAGIEATVVVSDDAHNIASLRGGLTDLIILDDPQHLFELDEFQWAEVGYMDMVHVDRGKSYIRYRYGAQRIAYSHLDASGMEYSVDAETHLLSDLIDSGKSFFVDEFLLLRRGIRMKSDTDKRLLRHSITAIYRRGAPGITRLVRMIQDRHGL